MTLLEPHRDTAIFGRHQWYLIEVGDSTHKAWGGAYFTSEHDAKQAITVAGLAYIAGGRDLADTIRQALP